MHYKDGNESNVINLKLRLVAGDNTRNTGRLCWCYRQHIKLMILLWILIYL